MRAYKIKVIQHNTRLTHSDSKNIVSFNCAKIADAEHEALPDVKYAANNQENEYQKGKQTFSSPQTILYNDIPYNQTDAIYFCFCVLCFMAIIIFTVLTISSVD